MSLNLNCIGIVRKKANNKYEFVVRWFINDPEKKGVTYLPNPEGKFFLTIRTKKSNEYIGADGTVSPIPPTGALTLPEISPMNYLMVAPPKDGSMPNAPIDPNDDQGVTGIGIYHILADPRQSAYAKKIKDRTESKLTALRGIQSNSLLLETGIDQYASQFAHYLIKENIKPRNLQPIFVNAFKRLEELTFKQPASLFTGDSLPGLFSFHLGENKANLTYESTELLESSLESTWRNATILSELFRDVDYLKEINSYVESAENLKAQFSMLVGQGVDIIDYWCNPVVSQPNRVENDCGRKYSLAEALGLGVTIGDIEPEILQRWFDNGDFLLLSLEYKPPTLNELLNSKAYSWKNYHDEVLLEDIPALSSPLNIIKNVGTNSLQNALSVGSSCPPSVPELSQIEYDLFLKRLKTDLENDEQLRGKIEFSDNTEIATGDGRALFKTVKPPKKLFPKKVNPDGSTEDELSSIVTGINVYGMWEPDKKTSPFKKYFDDLTSIPPINDLRQWLITRRYSYNQEIKNYFLNTNPNIKNIQTNPPRNPAFQSPGQNVNLEKIVKTQGDSKIFNEVMPKRNIRDVNGDEVIFSINIREGFKNKFDDKLPLTWDKFPITSLETDWHPNIWRGGEKKDVPQGYRFWTTSVDVFGQESTPISIIGKETNDSVPTTLFNFKYRMSLQPPPSNKEKEAKRITIAYEDEALKVTWESPFEANIGNSAKYKEPVPPPPNLPTIEPPSETRIPKSLLLANILYLKKPHNKESVDLTDEHLEEFIAALVSELPDDFKNGKWKVALREILKHNSNWTTFKSFANLTNTDTGDVWGHAVKLKDLEKGYDYMALINFTIKNDHRQLWVKNESKRVIHISVQKNNQSLSQVDFTTADSEIEELPCISNIAFTESQLVSNPLPPRLIKVLDQKFYPAKPILGIQGINRDLVISNIITTPNSVKEVEVEDEQSTKVKALAVNYVDDATKQFSYTDCQQALIEASFSRCLFDSKKPDLSISKAIIKKEFSNLNEKIFPRRMATDGNSYSIFSSLSNKNIIQSDLIGFRGVKVFMLRYNSIASDFEPYSYESEALKYCVYQTRIALNDRLLSNRSFQATAFTKIDELNYADVVPGNSTKLEEFSEPLLTVISYDDHSYSIHLVDDIIRQADGKYKIKLNKPVNDVRPGAKVTKLNFIVQTLILEKEIDLQKSFYEEELALPVGGGSREIFIWTFRTTSSLGKFSTSSFSKTEIYQTSILPPSLQNILASPINTTEQKDKYFLNPVKHKKWIPMKLQSETDDLKRFPRIFVKWTKDQNLTDDIFTAIERDFREEENAGFNILATPKNNWELASKVEKILFVDNNRINDDGSINVDYNPFGLFLLKWLSKSEKPTLYGWINELEEVQVPGEMVTGLKNNLQLTGPLSTLFKQKLQLQASTGIKSDPLDAGKVVFIDYFYDNEFLTDYMDTFRSYNYRLSSYIDIDPTGTFGITDPKLKYLYSKPSEWSGWLRPTFPEISLQKLTKETLEWKTDLLQPHVNFNFVFKDELYWGLSAVATKNLFYRVIVYREVANSIITFGDKPEGSLFAEIGSLKDIPVKQQVGEIYFIEDGNLERENNQADLSLNYKIDVSVIAKDTADRNYVIRKPTTLQITGLKLEANVEGKECVKSVFIKIG